MERFGKGLCDLERWFGELANQGLLRVILIEQPILRAEDPNCPERTRLKLKQDLGHHHLRVPKHEAIYGEPAPIYFRLLSGTRREMRGSQYGKPVPIWQAAGQSDKTCQLMFDAIPFDVEGRLAVLDSTGHRVFVSCGAMRVVLFEGNDSVIKRFFTLATSAGRLLADAREVVGSWLPEKTLSAERDELRWVFALFDLAWARIPGAILAQAEPKLLLYELSPFGGRDLEYIQQFRPREPVDLSKYSLAEPVPPRKPPRWSAEIADAVQASRQAIRFFLQSTATQQVEDRQTEGTKPPRGARTEQGEGDGGVVSPSRRNQQVKAKRGRRVDPCMKQRVAFAKPLRDAGKTWGEIAQLYQKKYKNKDDMEASADTIRLACQRHGSKVE